MVSLHWHTQHTSEPHHHARRTYLLDKVVLLVSNDTAVVQKLAGPLADQGADIALLCAGVPSEAIRPARERVESAGQRFLLIKEDAQGSISPSNVMKRVKSGLGSIDIFIDLSAAPDETAGPTSRLAGNETSPQTRWYLTQAALEEILGH